LKRKIAERLFAILFLVLSLYSYLQYQQDEFAYQALAGVILLGLGAHLLLSSLPILAPFRRMLPFLVTAIAITAGLASFRLLDYVAESVFGSFLASLSVSFSNLFLNAIGIHVASRGVSLVFPPGSRIPGLLISPECSGAYSTLAFLGLFVLMVMDLGRKVPKGRLLTVLFFGGAMVIIANAIRISSLALAGYFLGLEPMNTLHYYGGYVVFLAVVVSFWSLSLRWLLAKRSRPSGYLSQLHN